MLRKKQSLLHAFLPEEIINTIHHHWTENDEEFNLRSSSSFSSSSFPQTIRLSESDESSKKCHRTRRPVSIQHKRDIDQSFRSSSSSIQTIDTRLSSKTNSSKALYSEEAQNVSIIFVDIVGFSRISNYITPSDVMDMLQDLFHRFDKICQKYNILKLDTIGDAYLCSVGFCEDCPDEGNTGQQFALRALAAAKEMIKEAGKVPVPSKEENNQEFLSVRVGLHVGDATFGVLGQSLPKLTCVGSTVNLAARMEQTSKSDLIHATSTFHDLIGDHEKGWSSCETIELKNMGEVDSYYLPVLC